MDTIGAYVSFMTLDYMSSIMITTPSKEDIVEFTQGKTVITPRGKKITQVMYSGKKISLNWDGMSHKDFTSLKTFINEYGHDGFYYSGIKVNTDQNMYITVVDGLNKLDYKVRYNTLLEIARYNVTLKLVTTNPL